jgi:hypothetical protein
MNNVVKLHRIFGANVHYFLAHPSYCAGARAIVISATTQEDVRGLVQTWNSEAARTVESSMAIYQWTQCNFPEYCT